jgi:hypothetical protein
MTTHPLRSRPLNNSFGAAAEDAGVMRCEIKADANKARLNLVMALC